MEADSFGQAFHGKGAKGVNLLIARVARALAGCHQSARSIELRQQPVNGSARHSGLTSASGKSVRISKMEIMGRMRTNRNMAARNMPIVPM